ncbi:hypothetical protein Mgra_00002648 [Meloidogyne graminicola]|uniref:Uncharacterized protein n=1 Tax=Meloidogyne graminicola TaxID=189291 RepID=A0A8S9ZY70_9BILA|nr:hypothetical protein Mgra_00002648 [Meloidogyne graminicola]
MNPSQYPHQWQQHIVPGYATPIFSQNTGPAFPPAINLPGPTAQFIPYHNNYFQQNEQINEREKTLKLVEQLEKEKSLLEKEIEKLKLDYNHLKEESELKLQNCKKDHEFRLNEIEKTKHEVEEKLTKRIKELASDNLRLEMELEDIESDYKGLGIQNDKLKKDNELLVKDAMKDDEEIVSFQEQLKELYEENIKLNKILEEKKLVNERIIKEIEENNEKIIRKYKKRCSLAEEDLRKSQNILDKKDIQINNLKQQLIELNNKNEELKKELDAMKTNILIAESKSKLQKNK